MPITVTTQSQTHMALNHSNTGIARFESTWNMNVCPLCYKLLAKSV